MEVMNKKKIYLIISVCIIITLISSLFLIIFRHKNIEKSKIIQEEKIAQKTISAEKNNFNDSGNTQSVTIDTDGGLLKYIDFATSQELERNKVTRNYTDNSTIIIQTKYNSVNLDRGNIYIKSNLDNDTGYYKPVNENNSNYTFKQISVYKDGKFKEKLTPQVDDNNPWNYIWIYTVDKSKYGDSVELRVDWKTDFYNLYIKPNGGQTADSVNHTYHIENMYTRRPIYGNDFKFASTNYYGNTNENICLASTVDPLGDQSRRAVPYREGYTFKGWKITDENGNDISKYNVKVTSEEDSYLMPPCGGTTYYVNNGTYCGTIVVTAQWEKNTHTVTIKPDGCYTADYLNGNFHLQDSYTRTYTYGQDYKFASTNYRETDPNGCICLDSTVNIDPNTRAVPYKKGYTFKGWKLTDTSGNDISSYNARVIAVEDASQMPECGGTTYYLNNGTYEGNIVVTAEWETNQYNLIIIPGGCLTADNEIAYLHLQGRYTRTYKYGENFEFANTNTRGIQENGHICFNRIGGESSENRAVPYWEGHTFKGWEIKDSSGRIISGYNSSIISEDEDYIRFGTKYIFNNGTYEGDVYIIARWDINNYNVIFKDENNNVLKTQMVEYRNKATAPDNSIMQRESETRDITFEGWYNELDSNQTIINVNNAEVKSDITYMPKYTTNPKTFTVAFYDDDKLTKLYTATVEYGTNLNNDSNIPTPTKDNNQFEKWVDENGNDVDLSNIHENMDVYAKYNNEPTDTVYIINIDKDGGINGTDRLVCENNSSIIFYKDDAKKIMKTDENPLEYPTKKGYIFIGYYAIDENNNIDENKKLIDERGFITEEFYNNPTTYRKLIAKWEEDENNPPNPPADNIISIELDKNGGYNGTNKIYIENEENIFYYYDDTKKIMKTDKNPLEIPVMNKLTFEGYYLTDEGGNIDENKKLIDERGFITEEFYKNPTICNNKILKANWIGTGFEPEDIKTNEIQLNKDGGENGTDTIYCVVEYKNFYYIEEDEQIDMELNKNHLYIPSKEGYIFGGYYVINESGSLDETKQLIDEDGYLTEIFYNNPEFSTNNALKAKWIKEDDEEKPQFKIEKKKQDDGKVTVTIEVDLDGISKVEVKEENDSEFTDITESFAKGKYAFITPKNGTYTIKVTTNDGKIYEEEVKVTEATYKEDDDEKDEDKGDDKDIEKDEKKSETTSGEDNSNLKNTTKLPYAGKITILPIIIIIAISINTYIYFKRTGKRIRIIIKKD